LTFALSLVHAAHESVTDEYLAELQAGFPAEAQRAKSEPDWTETEKRMVTGNYSYLVAITRVEEGWTRDEIARELEARRVFGQLPNPLDVIGDEKRDEIAVGNGGVRPRE
jgi:hypothetical protein